MFKTYIISLKGEDERLQSVIRELTESHISPEFIEWFQGFKGSEYRNDNRVVPLCKSLCSDHMIGCGMSHIELARYFLDSNDDPYCVVLEDDVIIKNKDTFIEDVKNIYNTHSNEDIIKLFCQGFCNDDWPKRNGAFSFYMEGSTAGYILTREGAHKMSNMKIINHIDIQQNSLNLKNVPILITRDNEKHTSFYNRIPVLNQSIGFWTNQKLIGNITAFQYILMVIMYSLYIYKYNRSIIHINILMFLLAYINIMPYYVINDFQKYKISLFTRIFGILFPIYMIIYLSQQTSRPIPLLFLCHLMLMFNIIHQATV